MTRQMWRGEPVTFEGDFYSLDRAINTPRPINDGGPRIWIGEALDKATLDLVAKHADVWNSMPAGVDVLRNKISLVDEACRSRGRDPETLEKTLETQVLIVDTDAQWEQWLDRWAALREAHPTGEAMADFFEFVKATNPQLTEGVHPDRLKEEFVIGTKDEVIDKLRAYADLGISEVVCWFMDFPEMTTMRRLATEVRPELKV